MTRAVLLLALLLALPAAASAQEPPACAPDKTMDAKLTFEERGEFKRLVATHEVDLTADVANRTAPSSTSPDHVVITPEAGVQVIGKASGETIAIIAPATPTLTVVVSWRQTTDPANFDVTDKCSASHTFTLPVTAANPARGAKQPNPGPDNGNVTFAIAAAEAKRADLRPLVVSIRSTGHNRLPRAKERLRTWTVPMRTAEQLKYPGQHLPNPAYATTAQMCRYWWMTCGPAFADIASLNYDDKALNRGIERPDLDGNNSILRLLAYTQPARWASPLGVVINVRPGAAKVQLFGYDIQVRQAGRLLARVRRAGRCGSQRRSFGIFYSCTLSRSTTLLR